MLTIEFQNKVIKIIGPYTNPWFCGKDIGLILGYTNTKKALRDHVSNKHKTPLKDIENGTYTYNQANTIYINQLGLISLLAKSKMPNKETFIQWIHERFNINYKIITVLYKEQETIGQIIIAFGHLTTKRQYPVGKYSVDLYFPTLKLVIECDEHGHKDRDQDYETSREDYIKKSLQCTFIRYNPDKSDFSVFDVIQKIVLHIQTM